MASMITTMITIEAARSYVIMPVNSTSKIKYR